jgi:hypothetical protein
MGGIKEGSARRPVATGAKLHGDTACLDGDLTSTPPIAAIACQFSFCMQVC